MSQRVTELPDSSERLFATATNPNPAGKLCSWLMGRAKVARASRRIPEAIGVGALCNGKLKLFRKVGVKLLQVAPRDN